MDTDRKGCDDRDGNDMVQGTSDTNKGRLRAKTKQEIDNTIDSNEICVEVRVVVIE